MADSNQGYVARSDCKTIPIENEVLVDIRRNCNKKTALSLIPSEA
ncbi:hypothetical protein SDC9_205600 [bioreactor metagenome]|uniref:Uncharacterized protein n=1 Tax=bioreactor metagenome TaxID=1076179 RepID=A0A645JBZ0_9ZZZZ